MPLQYPACLRRPLAHLRGATRFVPALDFSFPITHEHFERFVRGPWCGRRLHFLHHLLFFSIRFVPASIENCRRTTLIAMFHNNFLSPMVERSQMHDCVFGLSSFALFC